MSELVLLFDLDGTLTDSRPGILASMRHALLALDLRIPPDEALSRFIGPPTHEAFRELLASHDPELNARAIAIYRQRYSKLGLFESSLYPGIAHGLLTLCEAQIPLFVVTSKPEVYANTIIDHFGLRQYFGHVYGSELSGERSNKGELISHVLQREGIAKSQAWMIGDRLHDVVGAKRNGLRSAGVLWGYGSRAELGDAGADVVFETMPELVRAFTS
jgi:phosphoglycolate phosphatase